MAMWYDTPLACSNGKTQKLIAALIPPSSPPLPPPFLFSFFLLHP